jgi:hypothetical protein
MEMTYSGKREKCFGRGEAHQKAELMKNEADRKATEIERR